MVGFAAVAMAAHTVIIKIRVVILLAVMRYFDPLVPV